MNFLFLFLCAIAFALIQCLIGGTRLIFSLPCYGLLAVAAILTIFSAKRCRVLPNRSCLIATSILAGYVLWRSSHSPINYLARPDFFMMLGCILFYGLTAFYISKTRDRVVLLCLFFAIAVLEVTVGTIQFKEGNGYMLFGFIRNDLTRRASGMFISANHFGGYLETVGLFALSLTVWSRWRLWAKILTGYITALCWFGVAISGSRGSYFSTIISLVAFAALSLFVVRKVNPTWFVRAWVILTIAVLAIIATAAFLMFHSSLLTERIHKMTAKDVRIYNWMAALDQFRVSPAIGTGAGTHLYYGRLFRRPPLQADPVHAHSDYLELLAEYGVVGVGAMAIFLLAHVRAGLRGFAFLVRKRLLVTYEKRSDSFALNIGALCAVVALAVHSVVDFNMHIPGNALLFAFVFALLASPGVEMGAENEAKLAAWFRFALPAVGAWFAMLGLPKIPAEFAAEQARIALRNRQYYRSIEFTRKALGENLQGNDRLSAFLRQFGFEKQNPDLYFYLGEANRSLALTTRNDTVRRNYFQKAVDAYRAGLQIFPQDENMLVRLGQSFDGLRCYSEAEEAYQKALQSDPNLGLIYGYYGTHLQAMGQTEEALDAYRKGQQLSNQSIEHLGKAELGL